jgi:ELKS/RAB6-interacting/CAST family protein 1
MKVSKAASKGEATEEQLVQLSTSMEQCKIEMQSAQSEVDRLLNILKDAENEKNEKENQIKELQE